jgi:chromosome segregation ATPase
MHMKEHITTYQQITYAALEVAGSKIHFKTASDALEEMKQQHKDVLAAYETAKAALAEIIQTCKAKKTQAIEEVESHHINYDDSNNDTYECTGGIPPSDLRLNIWSVISGDQDVLRAEIEALNNEVAATSNVRDRSVLQEFNETKLKLEQATKKLEEFKKNATVGQQKLQAEIDEWFETVNNVCVKINFHFQKLMQGMNCGGGVKLTNNADFKKVGIQIFVKFREGDNTNALSAGSNSGGERAVSTIMYLLSVQQLTSAPLRMVDEINQGMDAINERHCYNAVGNICSTEQGKTQFWLFSPKLLMNEKRFKYPEDITVLLVHGGASMISSNDWDLGDIIDAERKKKSGVKSLKNGKNSKKRKSTSSNNSGKKKGKTTGGKKRG